ncbi:MAG: IS200/IS605 family transposase [Bacteroidales bacterium]|nr:IS200/IS605 family transposase [Bacteroidales bacterium]
MANTYCQIYVHFVFAVQNRMGLIGQAWKDDLYKYITGTISNKGHKLMAFGGVSDHIHILVSMSPTQAISDLMADVKRSSSLWINERRLVQEKFSWQSGYGAFTYSKHQITNVANYIENQEEHHKTKKFRDKYENHLREFGIEYDDRYIFHEIQ